MALKGNLRDFPITQLLNLVNLASKTGTLRVNGSRDVVQINFRNGKLAYAQYGEEDNSLAAVLRAGKKISKNQYSILKQRSQNMSDKELGLLLINAGYVNQDDVINSLQQFFMEIIRRLFDWADGFFTFQSDEVASSDRILVRMDLENLIIEGSRRLDEREQLIEEIPSLEMALKFTDRPGTDIQKVNLSVEEWQVVSYVNPKNSMQQIAKATNMDEIRIRRIVYSLLQAGLVEIVRPGGAPLKLPNQMFPTQNKDEQKSLINRLITRIRSI
jgi:hypothetical protein